MESFIYAGVPAPFARPQLPVAVPSFGGVQLLPTTRRRGGDVCPHFDRQLQVSSPGGTLPIVTRTGVLVGEPMADARFAKYRSGSEASPLSG